MAAVINLAPLQDAVGNVLATNSAVTSALGSHNGRIQGATASTVAMPYITIGDDEVNDDSVQGQAIKAVRLKVHIWTAERGFVQSKAIEGAVVAALDDEPLTVAGLRVVSVFHRGSNFMRDIEDGVRHAVVEFDIDVVNAA